MAFKVLRKNCFGLDVHKTYIFTCIGITSYSTGQSTSRLAFPYFPRGHRIWLTGVRNTTASNVCIESLENIGLIVVGDYSRPPTLADSLNFSISPNAI